MASVVEDDGTSHPADPAMKITWDMDVEARTYVARWRWPDLYRGMPDVVFTIHFKVTDEGHWRVEDPGPPRRWIEWAVDCTRTELTLTRVGQEGCESVRPPPGSLIVEGETPPPAPPSAPVLPEKVLRFSR